MTRTLPRASALALSALALSALASACPRGDVPSHEGEGDVAEGEGELGEGEGEGEGEGDDGPLYDGEIRKERSLVWTDGAIVDDASIVGLGRVMAAAAAHVSALDDSGGNVTGGALFDELLRRFATTAHSERAMPARLADQLRDTLGANPSTWNLDDAPFKVTAVHNRVDRMGAGDDGVQHCGELRVSLASTDPLIRPFHMLFLFQQPAVDGDVVNGALTCAVTSAKWARLSDLDGADFVTAARAILDDGIVPERFVAIETVELTVSPWEWRQWFPTGNADIPLDNRPLFQQVDVDGVNAPGPKRDDFVAFVNDNAAALDARTLLLPERFRSPSTRVTQGAPWVALDLTGVSATSSHPDLRKHVEIVGCAACHTADAEFVQTREDRTFSPFYTKELTARATLLDDIVHRRLVSIPFGPLQSEPVLPP